VKIRVLALNTFRSFLRDKLILLFLILFACVVLLMMAPLLGLKAVRGVNAQAAQTMAFSLVASIMYVVSACGSLLAAWTGADSVAAEMKSGTILAVMARPVKRWEFLIGKYAGVMLLMAVYTVLMTGLVYLLLWLGGLGTSASPWELLVYPMVRYSIYAAIAMALVTVMHPVIAWAITMVIAVGASIVSPPAEMWPHRLLWIRDALYAVLPSIGLLSESRFMSLTRSSLKPVGWLNHVTALAYGLDYALICLLLAMWSFHYRSLRRD
jgi:ABC-type transport system involved in multi-copper enzyme maturation permease subunit